MVAAFSYAYNRLKWLQMENLVIHSSQGRDVTTSLIVAQVFGKEHSKVCRDIESLSCSESFRVANFGEATFENQKTGQNHKMYEITKDGFSFLVMGYNGKKAGEFKEMFINEFNKREMMLKSDDYILARSQEILHNRLQLAEQQLEAAQETISIQSEQLKAQAPKVEYADNVLNSVNTYTSTQMAKELDLRTAETAQAAEKLWYNDTPKRSMVVSCKVLRSKLHEDTHILLHTPRRLARDEHLHSVDRAWASVPTSTNVKERGCAMKSMVEEIKSLPISDNTARLIACIRMIQRVYGEVSSVIEGIYGEAEAERLINNKMLNAYCDMEDAIQEFVKISVAENLININMKAI
ncbi:phage Rha protein [Porphyromonas crevioricanis JCM 15906]|uniref:Phage Rha protein n=2 Tax=Porphyromonas crevioricanis TaxID=393921 RepID=S4PGA0_9PORP|nr:phage Rha protein [Porphyromonas crevioricanis JCM 15906]SJZ77635.1 phage regulatory protein, rha family [Porphyromonas crevioricanis]